MPDLDDVDVKTPENPEISPAETADNSNAEKFLIFSILGKLYSFPSRIIGEIALFDAVYPLPLLPSYIPGVVNRYSVPYALFDIGLLLNNTPSPRNKVLIFKDEIDHIAVLIDDVSGIADIQSEDLYILDRGKDASELTDTVYASFKWNNTDVNVLDIRLILDRAEGDII